MAQKFALTQLSLTLGSPPLLGTLPDLCSWPWISKPGAVIAPDTGSYVSNHSVVTQPWTLRTTMWFLLFCSSRNNSTLLLACPYKVWAPVMCDFWMAALRSGVWFIEFPFPWQAILEAEPYLIAEWLPWQREKDPLPTFTVGVRSKLASPKSLRGWDSWYPLPSLPYPDENLLERKLSTLN